MKKHNRFKGDLTGRRFTKWVVQIRDFEIHKDKGIHWICKCDCGVVRAVTQRTLLTGKSKSCGCLSVTVHGFTSRKRNRHPIYNSWMCMRRRCLDPKNIEYKNYGGRGITFCARWNDFSLFLKDMGATWERGRTLNRIDNNGNYCPENCNWATKLEQSHNTRSNVFLTFNGESKCLNQWARDLGVGVNVFYGRYIRGYPLDKLLSK